MSLTEAIDSLKKVDLAELDLNNLGAWPAAVKVIACCLLLIVALALGFNFYLKDLQADLDRQRAEEQTLKDQFSAKAFQAANLDAYKSQMAEMEESFGSLLRQLPSDTEVPGLLEDITRTGLGSGLEFEEIKLEPEMVKLYTNGFSEAELKELLAFYQTPVGRKVLEQMPQLMAHSAQLTQARLQQAVPEVDRLLGAMTSELKPAKP